MELHALDQNLALLGPVSFKSLIWIDRYNRVGTCEVYAPATERNLRILKIGNYLYRTGRSLSACQIVDVKIADDSEAGAVITAVGKDAKYLLDGRCNVSLQIFSSDRAGIDLESLIWRILHVDYAGTARALMKPNGYPLMITAGDASDVEGDVSQSVFGLSYGRIARQICGYLDAGYAFLISDYEAGVPTADRLPGFIFRVYSGADKRDRVTFSRQNGSVAGMSYERDVRNKANVCYAQNPDVRTLAAVLGDATSVDRVEKFFLTSVTPDMALSELKLALEGTWTLAQAGQDVALTATDLFVPVLSPWQLGRLRAWASGDTTTKEGYYHVPGPVTVATAKETAVADVTDGTSFSLVDVLFDYVLLCAAVEFMRDFSESELCDATLTDGSYIYETDYFLGDLVTVNANGVTTSARILEVLECWDENGYHIEPRTAYTETDIEQGG